MPEVPIFIFPSFIWYCAGFNDRLTKMCMLYRCNIFSQEAAASLEEGETVFIQLELFLGF